MLIVLIIILLLLILYNCTETFQDFLPSNQFTLFNYSYEKSPPNVSKLTYRENPNMQCCLIEKKFVYKPGETNNGDFNYFYTHLEKEKCNYNLYNLDSNKQLFIDGENRWSNSKCSADKSNIGSCRNVNKECIVFVTKEYCDQYRMEWSDKTCNNPLPFVWKDRVNQKVSWDDQTCINILPDVINQRSIFVKQLRETSDEFQMFP